MKAPREGSIEALYCKPAYYATDRELLIAIYYQQEKMMTALSDATAATAALIVTLQANVNKAFTDLEAAVAAAGGPASADVANAITALGSINTQLQAVDASALAADATTVPPVVTPPVTPAA